MPQPQHLDRLSAVDAAFLIQEGDSTHMHSSVAELLALVRAQRGRDAAEQPVTAVETAVYAGTNGAGDRS